MSWTVPLDIGVIMGLILAYPALALAAAFRLLSFPDLTIEGSLPLGAAAFGAAAAAGENLLVCIAAALLSGALAGALTAFLHVKIGINKFLAGVIVVAMTYSISLRIMGTSNISLLRSPTIFSTAQRFDSSSGWPFHLATIAVLALLLLAISTIGLIGLLSRAGTRMRVAGSNPEYARSLGISVPLYVIVGLAICNALAGGTGALLAMYQGFADVGMGQGLLILALASMTIGERLLSDKYLIYPLYVLLAAVIGSVAYQIIVAFAVGIGLAPTDLRLVTALFVLLIIGFRITRRDDEFLDILR
jgi:putative tryptophan/tyrosine transport system permease protein